MDKQLIEATLEIFRLRAELEAYRDESRKEQENWEQRERDYNSDSSYDAGLKARRAAEPHRDVAKRLTQILDEARFVPAIYNTLENTEA